MKSERENIYVVDFIFVSLFKNYYMDQPVKLSTVKPDMRHDTDTIRYRYADT
jgi:hypothetical protein